jgi:hypothetical protein
MLDVEHENLWKKGVKAPGEKKGLKTFRRHHLPLELKLKPCPPVMMSYGAGKKAKFSTDRADLRPNDP